LDNHLLVSKSSLTLVDKFKEVIDGFPAVGEQLKVLPDYKEPIPLDEERMRYTLNKQLKNNKNQISMTSIKAIVIQELRTFNREFKNTKVPYFSNKIERQLIAEHNLLPKITRVQLKEQKKPSEIIKFHAPYGCKSKMLR
jgi:hypothetical protein